jgi:hypothetical protein
VEEIAMGLRQDLIAIAGAENFIDESEKLLAYSKDYSLTKPSMPHCAVQPGNREEIQEIVKLSNKYKIPLTPCSSGVHFNGNTVPLQGGIILDLRRMNKILRVDERNRAIRIEPGVTWKQLQDELAKHDLMALTPLLPHSQKSALSSHLEREPMLIPKFEYGDPILNVEAILPKGELFRSGSACVTGFPDESAADGVNPQGPGIDWVKLFQGAQGTFGVVTWGIVKAEMKPKIDKTFFISFNTVKQAVEATYRIQKSMIGSECLLLNNFNLAAILSEKWPEDFNLLKGQLSPWTLVLVLAGGWRRSEERVEYEEDALHALTIELAIPKLQTSLDHMPGLERSLPGMLRTTWPEEKTYWKFGYKGSCQDIYFHTPMSRVPEFTDLTRQVATKNGYPVDEIGFYIQPIERGRVCHFESTFYYDPDDQKSANSIRNLYIETAEALMENGAFFTRPYGPIAEMVYDRAASYTFALKKTKNWLDPNNIMGSGRLCF